MKAFIKIFFKSIIIYIVISLVGGVWDSILYGGKWFGIEYFLRWVVISFIITIGGVIGYLFLKKKGVIK